MRENYLKIWRRERDEVHRKGVDARKDEAIRIKKIKDLTKQKAYIPIELTIPIIDPEAEWKASDVTWKEIEAEKAKKKGKGKRKSVEDNNDEEDKDIAFVLDSTGNEAYKSFIHGKDAFGRQEDFVSLEMEDENDESMDESIDESKTKAVTRI